MPTRKFHLLSKVLLRRFCDPAGEIRALDAEYPNARARPKSPAAVCYLTDADIKPANPFEFEEGWQTVERHLPEAFTALDDRSIVRNERLLNVLRECIALHFARSRTVAEASRRAMENALDDAEARMLTDPGLVSGAGLFPAGPEGRAIMAKDVRERMVRMGFSREKLLPESFVRNFAECRRRVKDHPLELLVAKGADFIIGDSPSQTLGKNGVGVLGGVAWDQADSVFMPLGPGHAVALAPATQLVEMEADVVEQTNRWQVQTAHRHVMWHPRSDHEDFVRTELLARLDGGG